MRRHFCNEDLRGERHLGGLEGEMSRRIDSLDLFMEEGVRSSTGFSYEDILLKIYLTVIRRQRWCRV